VPLTTTFIGVKSDKQQQQASEMDDICYDKVETFFPDAKNRSVWMGEGFTALKFYKAQINVGQYGRILV
jgi:hypothetical protein